MEYTPKLSSQLAGIALEWAANEGRHKVAGELQPIIELVERWEHDHAKAGRNLTSEDFREVGILLRQLQDRHTMSHKGVANGHEIMEDWPTPASDPE